MSQARTIRAPRGTQLTCKSWLTEAAYRMIQNNLDPEVAERPQDLVVYGGRGQAARSWEAFDAILETLRDLEDDETLLVQSGKPVAVFKTHPDAPRVLIANSNLVPHWATQEHFDELAAQGLDDVRADDRRLVDLHRHAGHPAGHLRDPRLAGQPARLAFAEGQIRADRRSGRDGRRAAAGDHHERGRRADRGGGPGSAPSAASEIGYVDVVVDTLEEAMTLVEEAKRTSRSPIDRPDRQRRRYLPRAGACAA